MKHARLRRRDFGRIDALAALQIARHVLKHLAGHIGEQRAIARHAAREAVVDNHRRNRGDETDRGCEQRLGYAWRDNSQIGRMRG